MPPVVTDAEPVVAPVVEPGVVVPTVPVPDVEAPDVVVLVAAPGDVDVAPELVIVPGVAVAVVDPETGAVPVA